MKTRGQVLSAARVTEGFIPSYTMTTSQDSAYDDFVSSSGLVVGDHKSPTPWSYDVYFRRRFFGVTNTYQYWDGRLASTVSGSLGGSSDNPDYPVRNQSLIYNMALSRLNEKTRGGLDLSIDLAELGSTRRMISGCTKLEGWLGSAKLPILRRAGNAFLQWKYGWSPLIQDIYGAADESLRYVLNRVERFTARATLPIIRSDVVGRTVNGTPSRVKREGRGKESCTFVIQMRIPDTDLSRWGTLNPLGLMWEVIPYSFVVDWFIDVSSFLRNTETALLYGPQFVSGYYSELYCYEGNEVAFGDYVTPDWYYRYVTKASASVRKISFSRTLLSSYPFPRRPSIRAELGSSRLLSAASLLSQRLGR